MVAFQIFGREVYRYGIFYFISFLLGYVFLAFLGKKEYFKKFPALQTTLTSNLEYLFIFLILGVLIGGRLGHVFIYDLGSFVGHWEKILSVRNGGMSFIGGILGVVIAVLTFKTLYKLTRKEFLILFDLILLIVPLGIFFGRLGNYLNQELYGIIFTNPGRPERLINTLKSLHFLHIYPNVDANLRINTNLLSMLFEGLLLFITAATLLFNMLKKQKFSVGRISCFFVIGYSVIRFLLEYLRNDSQLEFITRCTKSQRFFVLFFLFGILLTILTQKKSSLPIHIHTS